MNFLDNGNDDIKELLNNLIRIGRVSTVDYQKGTARVVFPDDDDIVSYDLPVLHRNAIRNKDYNMPDIDERVLCLFLPSGVATGFILGSVYTDTVLPPETTGNYRTVIFADGTRVRYDRDKHEFTAEIEGTKITANRQDVLVNTPNDVIVTAANNVTVNTKTATISAEMAIVGAQKACTVTTQAATITAPQIALNGDVTVSGNVIANGNVKGTNLIYKGAVVKE